MFWNVMICGWTMCDTCELCVYYYYFFFTISYCNIYIDNKMYKKKKIIIIDFFLSKCIDLLAIRKILFFIGEVFSMSVN